MRLSFTCGGLAVAGALAAVACTAPSPLGDYAFRDVDGGTSGTSANGGQNGTGGSSGPDAPRTTPQPHHPAPDAGAGSPSGADASTGVISPGGGDDASTPTADAAPVADAGMPSPPADGGASSALLQRCVDDVNAARSQLGLSPLARSGAIEAYAALAASSDAQSGTTHGYYNGNSGGGVSAGEAELPGWPLAQYASMSDLVDQGVTAIVNLGPGSRPYDDLASTTFTQVGCGSFATVGGNVWVAIDFH